MEHYNYIQEDFHAKEISVFKEPFTIHLYLYSIDFITVEPESVIDLPSHRIPFVVAQLTQDSITNMWSFPKFVYTPVSTDNQTHFENELITHVFETVEGIESAAVQNQWNVGNMFQGYIKVDDKNIVAIIDCKNAHTLFKNRCPMDSLLFTGLHKGSSVDPFVTAFFVSNDIHHISAKSGGHIQIPMVMYPVSYEGETATPVDQPKRSYHVTHGIGYFFQPSGGKVEYLVFPNRVIYHLDEYKPERNVFYGGVYTNGMWMIKNELQFVKL